MFYKARNLIHYWTPTENNHGCFKIDVKNNLRRSKMVVNVSRGACKIIMSFII